MARSCSICTHAQRADIDRRLVAGEPNRVISRHFALGHDAVRRHAQHHLPTSLVAAQEAHEVAQADTLMAQVRALQGRAQRILERAEGAGDLPTALKAIRELRGVLELLARLEGELHDGGTTVNIVASPDWIRVRGVILAALTPHPDARAAVAAALLSHAGAP